MEFPKSITLTKEDFPPLTNTSVSIISAYLAQPCILGKALIRNGYTDLSVSGYGKIIAHSEGRYGEYIAEPSDLTPFNGAVAKIMFRELKENPEKTFEIEFVVTNRFSF